MKRITCFIESLSQGGAQHQILILANLLLKRGYDVTLVTYADVADHYVVPEGISRVKIKPANIKIKFLRAFVKLIRIFFYFFTLRTDSIISYRQCCNARLLIPMLFRSRKVKIICSERNLTIDPTFYEKLLFNFLYRRSDYIVANSVSQTQYIKGIKPKLAPKLLTINNYTDIDKFTTSSLPEDLSIIKIAVFGRYDSQKNPITFAYSLSELKSKTKQKFEVHWYGGIDGGSIYSELSTLIKDKDIDDCFILHDAVKNPMTIMDEFHAICLPSLYEGFSNSIAEGICCGKPMLVSAVSDNPIMVNDGINGFLFDPRSHSSICDAFLKFFALSYSEMCQMSNESRKIAETLFSKENFISQYIKIIEE